MIRTWMLVALFTFPWTARGMGAAAVCQDAVDTIAGKVESLFSPWDGMDSPGAAVAVIQDGSVAFMRGYGMADLEHAIPITPSTVFDIASVSKQFTGLAVAMLADEGKLDLDEDIRTYLPYVPDFGKTITLRHLVHHTSGLRDWPRLFRIAGRRYEDVISFEDILELVRNQRELNFAPGTDHLYSNTGYNLLAAAVAKATGQTFSAWTQARIFEPLEMNDTHFHDDHAVIVKNRARSYVPDEGGGFKNVGNNLTAPGSSSLYTTIEDLTKWALNFEQAKVAGPEVIARMHERGVLNNGRTVDYGFGVNLGTYRGLATVEHAGGWAGFRTFLVRFPSERFAVILLSNLGTFQPGVMAKRIADLLLSDRIEDPERIVKVNGGPENFAVDPASLAAYEGTFRLGPGWLVTITSEDGRLMTQATNEAKFEMTPVSEDRFFVKAYGAHVEFERNREGEVTNLLYRRIRAERVEPFDPDAEKLLEYVGEYKSEELGATCHVVVKNGGAVLIQRWLGEGELIPCVTDQFRVASGSGLIGGAVDFLRDAEDEITGFRFSENRVKRLLFVKRGR